MPLYPTFDEDGKSEYNLTDERIPSSKTEHPYRDAEEVMYNDSSGESSAPVAASVSYGYPPSYTDVAPLNLEVRRSLSSYHQSSTSPTPEYGGYFSGSPAVPTFSFPSTGPSGTTIDPPSHDSDYYGTHNAVPTSPNLDSMLPPPLSYVKTSPTLGLYRNPPSPLFNVAENECTIRRDSDTSVRSSHEALNPRSSGDLYSGIISSNITDQVYGPPEIGRNTYAVGMQIPYFTAESPSLHDRMETEIRREEIIIEREIGRGAFGWVSAANWRGIKVAVKKSRAGIEELVHEAEMLKKLHHKNIVHLYGTYEDTDGGYCMVIEFANLGNLFDLIHKEIHGQTSEQLIPFDQLLDYAKQISSAMHYLHNERGEENFIHRDLKSPNILVCEEYGERPVLKICDFGTARKFTRDTFMSFTGTFAWMAPEILRNEKASKRADVYSFGVVLWEMLTGQEPFANMDPMSIAWVVMDGETLPIPTGTPEPFKSLLTQCFNTEPQDRPDFAEIVKIMQNAEKTRGIISSMNTFHATAQTWRGEISGAYEHFRRGKERKQEEMQQRESQLREKEEEIIKLQKSLAKFQEQLKRSESSLDNY
eukprot:CFRG3023T1